MPKISRYLKFTSQRSGLAAAIAQTNNRGFLVSLRCSVCKEEFRASLFRYQSEKGARFCSKRCYMSVYAKGMKNCIKCRKEFIPCNRETKYCSHECFNEVRRRGKFVNCGICGKTVYRKRKNLKKSNFCSIDCLGAAKSVAWSIEWRRDRKIFAAKYRGLVLLRDNYTCQKCGIKQTNLEVHHVKPFRIFRELRFRLDNCVTLCPSCHILEDKWRRMKERAENKQVLEIH